jgi:hypothetical protein
MITLMPRYRAAGMRATDRPRRWREMLWRAQRAKAMPTDDEDLR